MFSTTLKFVSIFLYEYIPLYLSFFFIYLSEEKEFHRTNADKHKQWFFNAVICRLGETSS